MRTRRSPRNQDILFRALGGPLPLKPEPVVTRCCGNCTNYRDTGRARGLCHLKGVRVAIMSAPSCYVAREVPSQSVI